MSIIKGVDTEIYAEAISSSSAILDDIAGGSFPDRRLVEIFSLEGFDEISIKLNAIADAQRKGDNALLINVEQALEAKVESS